MTRYVSILAALAAALSLSGTAHAHPHGLHTWAKFKQARLDLPHRPREPGAFLIVWMEEATEQRKELRAEWERFDDRYWAAVERRQARAERVPELDPAPVPSSSVDWYAIAECESGGNWSINTGNGYYGGLQFSQSTWLAYGGPDWSWSGPFPFSVGTQIAVAEQVLDGQGIGAWPHCGAYG